MILPSASDDAPSHNDQHLSNTDADEEEVIQENQSAGDEKSRQVYIGSGNDTKALYLLLSIGLNCPDRNEEPLFSFETVPWSLLPKLSMVRPEKMVYVNEIMRRAKLYSAVPLPRARNWNRVQTMA